jgi:hypothetical protein
MVMMYATYWTHHSTSSSARYLSSQWRGNSYVHFRVAYNHACYHEDHIDHDSAVVDDDNVDMEDGYQWDRQQAVALMILLVVVAGRMIFV